MPDKLLVTCKETIIVRWRLYFPMDLDNNEWEGYDLVSMYSKKINTNNDKMIICLFQVSKYLVIAGRSWFRNVWGFVRGNGRGKRTDGFRLSCIETKSIIFSFHISYGSKPSLGNIALHDEIQLWQKCFDCDSQQMWKSPSKGLRSKKQVKRLTKIVVFWQNIRRSNSSGELINISKPNQFHFSNFPMRSFNLDSTLTPNQFNVEVIQLSKFSNNVFQTHQYIHAKSI